MSGVAQANEQARRLRRETEREIGELIERYQVQTGLEVDGIEVVTVASAHPLAKIVRIEARL